MARFASILAMLALALVLALGALIVAYRFVTPASTLMLARRVAGTPVERAVVPLERISPYLPAAVIASEDAKFCRHHGVDWGELRAVMKAAGADGPSRGASTISMQTVKNLLLWPGRSALRKAIEIPLALVADLVWGKRRTLELYLNVAEWGDGIFGAQAAAQRYFGKSADRLDARQAALLAASLPNPKARDPGRPSRFLSRRAATIEARMREADVSCLK
ncbi:monofunctional biosynthetic peptidoglycan transglycosylase [Methylocella sp.]|uniref:monofunctional biosynthetic peptidoglycan transglycosylase n=1 Tax=Methylocella sp. TaxID=1978226 RepID=UPI003784A9DB